ncbi:hypothetical protein P4U05_28850 [Bacillus paranthracis]|uniref:hypothetical protein n=1 Tax=Bacillus paranthracis TaxID=2026186 RepID=UPI001F55A222|nr:hypothetical protein [Bacillus paranthracis]MED0787387.1 hypothetical protein [Bacillus paranthracis]MED0813525.1 hypothetical protein [Bacillus paranthracis]MED0818950.1 hypothetical protein [Bacillus paranthracis]MED0863679.1 hypothetical protein [Bacillus paranthracis]MED1163746.1 hypothetical protein [Bacillus paranthracis]
MDKSWSDNSAQLLQEIDGKMGRIESILQQVSIDDLIEETYEIHEMLIKVSQLLLDRHWQKDYIYNSKVYRNSIINGLIREK